MGTVKIKTENIITNKSVKIDNSIVNRKFVKFISDFGCLRSLIVCKDAIKSQYEVVDGYRTYLAGKEAGIKEFDCYIISEEQKAIVRTITATLHTKVDNLEIADLVINLSENELDYLPYDRDMIDTLKTITDFDWNRYHIKKDQQKLF